MRNGYNFEKTITLESFTRQIQIIKKNMDTREGEHCSELPDQEVLLDNQLESIWRKHPNFIDVWTTLHCLGREMNPVLLQTARVIDTLREEEKSLMILIDIRKEYGQEVADLVAEYSHHRWKVEEVTTESRQFSEKDEGNLSQNVKKLMLASILVSLKTLDADQKLSAEKIKRSRYSVRDYRGANQKIEAEVGKILMKYKST